MSYYDKIDPSGFRFALMAQIENRLRTLTDYKDVHLNQNVRLGTPEELAEVLVGCVKSLSMEERMRLIK